MISSFKVAGFRSLQDFSIDLRPGLNVLVGPNGAGKTNIVDALELLSLLGEKPVSEAIGQLGGTGAIISKISSDTYAKEIRFEVTGDRLITREKYLEYSHAQLAARESLRGIRWARYRYVVVISVDKERVRIGQETFALWLNKVRRTRGEVEPVTVVGQKPDYGISRVVDVGQSRLTTFYSSALAEKFSDFHYERRLQNQLNDKIFGEADFGGEKSLIWHIRQMGRSFILRKVLDDFVLGAPLNIVPSRVREAMDISAEPELQRDGYGFGAVLWALQKRSMDGWRSKNKPTVAKLVEYARRANPNIDSITAELDPWDSKIRVAVGMSGDRGTVKVPISALSDGTLKWLALMIAVITGVRMLAIEEPENYVHPAIQKALVEILRERFGDGAGGHEFVLLTTHSETLINGLVPDEMVVVSMSEGRTSVSRPRDAALLLSEIRKTGFGLGHYYLMGALSD